MMANVSRGLDVVATQEAEMLHDCDGAEPSGDGERRVLSDPTKKA
jgi:hypothetical protein